MAALQALEASKRLLCGGIKRRAVGGMDDDPVFVVSGHRLVRLEDRDTLPQTRPYALIRFIT